MATSLLTSPIFYALQHARPSAAGPTGSKPLAAVGAGSSGGSGGNTAASSGGSSSRAALIASLDGRASSGTEAFDIAAALRAARKAGIELNLPPEVKATALAASATAANSLSTKLAALQASSTAAAAAGAAEEADGSDDDDEGDNDGSDVEYGDDGRRIKRKGVTSGAAAGRESLLSPDPSPDVEPVFTRGSAGPHLVVCPTSVLANWAREIATWCPQLKVRGRVVWSIDAPFNSSVSMNS